jgi:hypothetical protein
MNARYSGISHTLGDELMNIIDIKELKKQRIIAQYNAFYTLYYEAVDKQKNKELIDRTMDAFIAEQDKFNYKNK